ncbi:MAG TPA: CrcB family protein [Microbacterium sp.]|nr:CrcB family protein [Microbacterium sp.]
MVRAYLSVAVGGLIGTGLRLASDLAFPHDDAAFPFETLLVNLGGTFVLGWLVGGLWTRPSLPTWMKAGLGAGVLGSFTTLSAVMASIVVLSREGEHTAAAVYLGVSIVGGLLLAVVGLRIGALIAHRPMPTDITDAGETL